MGRGLPDHRIGIYLLSAFGYTEKVPMYEVAPWTVIYRLVPTTLTDGKFSAALGDSIGRPRVIVDSLPTIDPGSNIFQVDIQKVLGDVLSKTNPVHVQISDGTDSLDPRDRNWDLAGATDIVGLLDKWDRQLGLIDISRVLGAALSKTNPVIARLTDGADFYVAAKTGQLPTDLDTGSLKIREQNPITGFATQTTLALIAGYTDGIESLLAGGLPTALDTDALKIREQDPLTSIDVGNLPTDFPDWAVATLLGAGLPSALDTDSLKVKEQDWPDVLVLPTAIGTLADVTAAASATRLIVASTPCKTVTVKALSTNTGQVRVGDTNVSASRGHELDKNQPVDIAIDNVNRVYIFGNGSDKVSVVYVN